MFTIFAIQVLSNQSVGRRKLTPNKYYYFLEGFEIDKDGKLIVDKYRLKDDIVYQKDSFNPLAKSPKISITAIVGENGSGKSSIIEFCLRLINNFAATTIGEYEVNPGAQHLHYIDGVEGELYYLIDNVPYRLRVQHRNVTIESYSLTYEDRSREIFVLHNTPDIFDNEMSSELHGKDTHNYAPMQPWRPSKYDVEKNHIKTLKDLYNHFFYTYVSNYSIYAYNTLDFESECNSDAYEEQIRKRKKKSYDTELKNWLNGIFHKNDGYQTPIVLSPFREVGNIDINVENILSRERLLSLLISPESNFRTINGHLTVSGFVISKLRNVYDAKYLKKRVGFHRLQQRGYDNLKRLIIKYWSEVLNINLWDYKEQRKSFEDAVGYLVYKTLKVSSKYRQYHQFFKGHENIAYKVTESQLADLIKSISNDKSHITNKIRQTLCYLIGGTYELENEHQYFKIDDLANRVKSVTTLIRQLESLNNIFKFPDDLIPPPFMKTTIQLVDEQTNSPVLFETLSSGEKQQTYSISALMYHLANLDSVWEDNNQQRIVYEHVNMVMEEIELYFHPELQRTYVFNILDGVKQLDLKHIKDINICFVTHSPFILSDIPSRNILALKMEDENNEQNTTRLQTFGANIHSMLKYSFFLKHGPIGKYATKFIQSIVSDMEKIATIGDDNNLFNSSQLHEKIMLIDEPIVRMALLSEYHHKFHVNNDLKIKELERQIQELKNK
ncbi:MAG: AAA family ATPase [Bacteroides sp.]|nr:AAA family ATPase [Bacteroides sp.]